MNRVSSDVPRRVLPRREECRKTFAVLFANLFITVIALTGCAVPTAEVDASKTEPTVAAQPGSVLTVNFTPPTEAWISKLQQALADGHQPWRNDPFMVALVDFGSLLNSPPPSYNEEQLQILRSIDRAAVAVEKAEKYEMNFDAAKRMHIVFPAPPYSVDATMTRAQARKDLPAFWITHDVVLTPLPR